LDRLGDRFYLGDGQAALEPSGDISGEANLGPERQRQSELDPSSDDEVSGAVLVTDHHPCAA
jgi:hypothetical protein